MASSIGKEAATILSHIKYMCTEYKKRYVDDAGIGYLQSSYEEIGDRTIGRKRTQIYEVCKRLEEIGYIEIRDGKKIPCTRQCELNKKCFYMTQNGIDFCNSNSEESIDMWVDNDITQKGKEYNYVDVIASYLDYICEHKTMPIIDEHGDTWCPHSYTRIAKHTSIPIDTLKRKIPVWIIKGYILSRTERNMSSYRLNYEHELFKNYQPPDNRSKENVTNIAVSKPMGERCKNRWVTVSKPMGHGVKTEGSRCKNRGVYILETQKDTQENVMTRNSSVKRKNKICYQDSNVIEKEGKYFESNKNLTGASNVTNIQVGKRTPQKLEDVVKRIREKDRGYIPTNEELDKLVDDELYGRNDMTEEITEFDDFCDEDRPRVLVEINTFISRHISKYAWLYDANQSILLLCIQNINTQQFITNKVVKKPLGLTITFLRDFAGSILNKLNEGGLNVRSR